MAALEPHDVTGPGGLPSPLAARAIKSALGPADPSAQLRGAILRRRTTQPALVLDANVLDRESVGLPVELGQGLELRHPRPMDLVGGDPVVALVVDVDREVAAQRAERRGAPPRRIRPRLKVGVGGDSVLQNDRVVVGRSGWVPCGRTDRSPCGTSRPQRYGSAQRVAERPPRRDRPSGRDTCGACRDRPTRRLLRELTAVMLQTAAPEGNPR
jgi:hypothetical protein